MQTMTIPLLALHCEAQFVSRGATQEAWPLCLKECVLVVPMLKLQENSDCCRLFAAVCTVLAIALCAVALDEGN